ncbi:MAG: hypothetical protein CFE43_20545 [Burkholderiales bacterium PBB3]|nr:MAG: hypothetical protein CFE43_20545 [Burkholderiales bacterium PBB3]
MDGVHASPQNGHRPMSKFCTAGLQKPTNTTLKSGDIQMNNSIRNLIGLLVLGSPLSLLAANGGAQITMAPYRPVISLAIYGDSNADPAINVFAGARSGKRRHCIEAQIEESESLQASPTSIVGKEIDIYVGILSPNQRVRTWTPVGMPFDERRGVLNEGIVPYAQKYVPQNGFRLSQVKLESICVIFNSDDPIGHYSWFVWLIQSGKPLNNPQNWIGLASLPFFLFE